MLGKRESAQQTLLRLHEKYPEALAFKGINDTRISAEQRLLELKLEKLGQQCKELLDVRVQYYSAPGKKLVLPKAMQIPDVLQLREDRLNELNAAQVKVPLLPKSRLELMKLESKFANDKLNDYDNMSEYLEEFFRNRRDLLGRKRYLLLLHWARATQSVNGLERLSPGMVTMLDSCLEEYEICGKNHELLKQYRSTIPKGLTRDGAIKLPPFPLTHDAAKIVTRWTAYTGRMQRRLNKFFVKMAWIPCAKRHDTTRKAKDLVAQSMLNLSSSTPNVSSFMPTMVSTLEKLNTVLEQLRAQFEITAELEEEDGQKFLYEANKVSQAVHASQSANKVFPSYGCSIGEKVKALESEDGGKKDVSTMDLKPSDVEATYLKESNWINQVIMQPELDAVSVHQNSIFFANKKLDHILKVEISFVDEDDFGTATRRVNDQVATHMDRAVPFGDVDNAGGTAPFHIGGNDAANKANNAPTTTKTIVPLPIHKLTPLYWLRLLRLRQAKRKILALLNYFRSIERTLCIDARGYGFNAAAFDSYPPADESTSTNNNNNNNMQPGRNQVLEEKTSGKAAPTVSSIRNGGRTVEHSMYAGPDDYHAEDDMIMSFEHVENRDDFYSVDEHGLIRVKDSEGIYVMYDAAIADLKKLDDEVLRIGSHYILQYKERHVSDRVSMLEDLYDSEVAFHEAKRKVVMALHTCLEHSLTPESRREISQRITNTLAKRPHLDLTAAYPSDSYSAEIVALELEASLLRDMLSCQVQEERAYRNFVHSRVHETASTYGFPDAVYENPSHSPNHLNATTSFTQGGLKNGLDRGASLLNGLSPVICPVTNEEVGPLDLFPSLAKIPTIMNLIDWSVDQHKDLLTSFHPVLVAALRICILQQGLIEWRLIVEEDALISEAQKQSYEKDGEATANIVNPKIAALGITPWSQDTLMIDDPFAMDIMVSDICKEHAKAAQPTQTQLQTQQTPSGSKSGDHVRDELILAQSDLNVYIHCWSLMTSRQQLLDTLDETDALRQLYLMQAKLFGEDNVTVCYGPIQFEGEPRHSVLKPDPLGIDVSNRLAIAEIDPFMAAFDFNSVTGTRVLLSRPNDEMRVAVKFQYYERTLLAISLLWNQTLVDHCEREGDYQEDVMLGLRPAEGTSTFMTAVNISRGNASTDVGDRRNKARAEGRRAFQDIMRRHCTRWMSVGAIKKPRREALAAAFNTRQQAIIKGPKALSGIAAVRKLRELKYELLSMYFEQVSVEMAIPAVQIDVIKSVNLMFNTASALPKRQHVFTVTEDLSNATTYLMTSQDPDDGEAATRTFLDNGQIGSLFHLPTTLEIIDHLPPDFEILTQYFQAMTALYDIASLSRGVAALGVSAIESISPNAGMDGVQAELLKLRTMISGISPVHKRDVNAIATFVSNYRKRMFFRLQLSLQAASHRLVSTGSVAHVPLMRSIVHYLKHPKATTAASVIHEHYMVYPQQRPLRQRAPVLFSDAATNFGDLRDGLLGLEGPNRAIVVTEANKLDLMCEEVLNQNGLSETSMPEEAAEAVLKLLESSATLEILKTHLMKKVLNIPFLRDSADLRRWDNLWDTRIVSRLNDAKEEADKAQAAIDAAALAMPDQDTGFQKRQSERTSVLHTEAGVRSFLVGAVIEELHQLSLTEAIQQQADNFTDLSQQIEYLSNGGADRKAELEELARITPAGLAPPKKPKEMKVAMQHQIKVDIVLEFLADLRDAWAVKRQKDGTQSLLLPQDVFNKAVDSLARKLRDWGNAQGVERMRSLQVQNNHLRHLLYIQERNATYIAALRELDKRSMERRIDAAVTDQCYTLLFRIDSLNKQLGESGKALQTMETTVREQVRKEFEELVRELDMQLKRVRAQFSEYKDSLHTDMKGSIHIIRKEALMKLSNSQTAPMELRRVTEKMASSEDQIAELTTENASLKRALLKLRTLNQMKDVSQKAAFDKQIQKVEGEKQHANKELYLSRDEVEQKMTMLKKQLEDTQTALLHAEMERDKLKKDLELANRNKQALLQWKVAKSMLLEELEAKVAKFEKWSHVDVDKLVIELERKDALLKQLHSGNNESVVKHRQLIENKAQKEIKRLKTQIAHEQRMKNEAFQKLEAVRNDFRWDEHFENNNDQEGSSNYWKKRYYEMDTKLQTCLEENDRLWQLARESGIDIPANLTDALNEDEMLSPSQLSNASSRVSTAVGGTRASAIEALMEGNTNAWNARVGSAGGIAGAARRNNKSAAGNMQNPPRPHSTIALQRPATTMSGTRTR